jgi:hypothetical protein
VPAKSSQAEYILTLHLDRSISAAVLATELAQHVAPLVARRKSCGDIVVGQIEGDWSLEGDLA